MRVLVLGAYGLIGTHILIRLRSAGHEVVGLGRDTRQASRRFPEVEWITADLSRLLTAEDWVPILVRARCRAIVNAAGALQDGARDSVANVQSRSMRVLYGLARAHGADRFVQVSATRAQPDAGTNFMRTKAEADRALAASDLDWVILRPGLVLSPEAYGGTALLRALAAMPIVVPIAFAETPVQTIAGDDVAEAVLSAIEGSVPARRIYDLVEDTPHSLRTVQRRLRAWLGLAPAREWEVPAMVVRCVALIADGLGWLGWRSPFRSTAVAELQAGIRGDGTEWRRAGGHVLKPLDATLRALPSTVQERWFARAFLLKPLAIAVLAAFWIVTGVVALAFPDQATGVLSSRGVGDWTAGAIVVGGGIVDIALGLAILVRSTTTRAALGMILVTAAYLLGASVLAPGLWLDPLGPLLKALPAVLPALLVLALDGER